MLYEFALTPNAFHPGETDVDAADERLRQLKDLLLDVGLVRDLRDGKWSECLDKSIVDTPDRWHMRGKELLKKLKGRLHKVQAELPQTPESDDDWLQEAVKSHEHDPLTGGIITGSNTKNTTTDPLKITARVNALYSAPWWQKVRPSSVRIQRTMEAYIDLLNPILKAATHIMFIDQYIDPCEPRYRGLLDLILATSNADIIEIHCASIRNKEIIKNEEWKVRFKDWDQKLKSKNKSVQVYLRDPFHDRYLITNLVGIALQNGFDTRKAPNEKKTTWSRVDRQIREDVQKDFHPSEALYEFCIGCHQANSE